jgi:hypothetical protein
MPNETREPSVKCLTHAGILWGPQVGTPGSPHAHGISSGDQTSSISDGRVDYSSKTSVRRCDSCSRRGHAFLRHPAWNHGAQRAAKKSYFPGRTLATVREMHGEGLRLRQGWRYGWGLKAGLQCTFGLLRHCQLHSVR